MRIFGNLKISLLKVLSIGGRKSVHGPPPHARLCFLVFLTSDRPWVDSNFRLYGPHFHPHTRCACPPPCTHYVFPTFWSNQTIFKHSRSTRAENCLCADLILSQKHWKTKVCMGGGHAHLNEPSTTSRRPHQARLQIDLQNDFQIDYVCSLTT